MKRPLSVTPRRRTLVGLGLGAALLLGALVIPAGAAPVCAPPAEGAPAIPTEVCGGRIFAEAVGSVSFIQHDSGEYEAGIKALAAEFPDLVRIGTLAEHLNDPAAVSVGGRDIWVVEITDFSSDEEKIPVAVSLSVHGPERAGIEGGIRYVEDLARWATSDPDHQLCNGTEPDSQCFGVGELLEKVHLYVSNINPDGWSNGDIANGGVFSRGNANGTDLNRQFPTKGWTKTSGRPLPMVEPEAIAWVEFVNEIKPKVAADLHGELTSVNNAFADMMWPAGQWDPLEQAQEESFARHMESNVYRYFEEEGIVLGDIMGELQGMRPAAYATAYDVVGYDDSGFMGDWFTEQVGALEIDVEHFLSHQVPNSTWLFPLEEAHIAAARAEIETMIVEALVTDDIEVSLDVGRTGYLEDLSVITDSDENGYGGSQPPEGRVPLPYSSTRMRYFEDLSKYTTVPLEPVRSGKVRAQQLRRLDAFVVSDVPYPKDDRGPHTTPAEVAANLKEWVQGGGNLVLTDGALVLLEDMGVVPAGSVRMDRYNAGHIDIDDFEHRFTQGLPETASQTYYEVPLGYNVNSSSTRDAPHWTVDMAAWTGAGGIHVASIGDQSRTGLGEIELGSGSISIIGALLPQATEEHQHLYGLADYGVTVTGGTIFNRMLGATP
jgi:hypothetical protein